MFPDQTPHSAKSDLDLDCLSISHGCIHTCSYFDLFIAQVFFCSSELHVHVLGLIMSEISNAFEHFIVLLMKSDSHFLNKGDSCISTNSTCMYILTIVPIYIAQLIQCLEI